MDGTLTIGRVARLAGVRIDTVRYYERRGLLPAPPRTDGGYRAYDHGTVAVLRFIRRAQELGFTLREIEGLLELRGRPSAPCHEVKATAEAKIRDIDARIRDLTAMRTALEPLVEACGSGGEAWCPILEALAEPT